MRLWANVFIVVLAAIVCAQCAAEETISLEDQSVSIEARVIEAEPPVVRAEGDVLMQLGMKRLYADSLTYDYATGSGSLTNAVFTTCDRPKPDYHIAAQSIELSENQRLRLRRVRLYLGGTRVLGLPRLSLNASGSRDSGLVLPRVGFSSRDGAFAAIKLGLVNTPDDQLDMHLKLTTNNGIQGGFVGAHALTNNLDDIPEFQPDSDSELRSQRILWPVVGIKKDTCAFPDETAHERSISVFASLLSNDDTYDVDEPDLLVSRLPEIGVRYVSPMVLMSGYRDNYTIGARADVRASIGRYKESPGDEVHERFDLRGTGSTTIKSLGKTTAVRALGLARLSLYDGGDSYRVLGEALEISRVFSKGSYASLRLILHQIWGETPFEFDDVDVERELQLACRYSNGANAYGVMFDYDLDRNELRDWELSYTRSLHCMEPTITWRSRYSQLSLSLRVLGL